MNNNTHLLRFFSATVVQVQQANVIYLRVQPLYLHRGNLDRTIRETEEKLPCVLPIQLQHREMDYHSVALKTLDTFSHRYSTVASRGSFNCANTIKSTPPKLDCVYVD